MAGASLSRSIQPTQRAAVLYSDAAVPPEYLAEGGD